MRKVNSQGSIIDRSTSRNSIVDLVDYFNQEHFKQNTEIDLINKKLDQLWKSTDILSEHLVSVRDMTTNKNNELRDQLTMIICLLFIILFFLIFF